MYLTSKTNSNLKFNLQFFAKKEGEKNNAKNNQSKNQNSTPKGQEFINSNLRDPSTITESSKDPNKGAKPKTKEGIRPNDYTWYCRDEQLARVAGNLSYYSALGMGMPLSGKNVINAEGIHLAMEDVSYRVPGLLVYNIVPTIGSNKYATDPATIAASKLFSFVTGALGKRVSYERTDLFMSVMAATSVYAIYAELLRLYGLLNSFKTSGLNRYMPEKLISALGYDYEDFRLHINDFRAWLITYSKRVNAAVWIPKDINYFKRIQFVNESIYADNNLDSGKAQLYITRLAAYYKWTPKAQSTGSSLTMRQYIPTNGNIFTYKEATAFAEDLLNALIEDEDFSNMAGDLRKTYGDANLIKIPDAPDTFEIVPEYSLEILVQLQNAESLNLFTKDTLGEFINLNKVTQLGNVIITDLTVSANSGTRQSWMDITTLASLIYDKLITCPVKDPDYKDNMVNIQYMINTPIESVSLSAGTTSGAFDLQAQLNPASCVVASICGYTIAEGDVLTKTNIQTVFKATENGILAPSDATAYAEVSSVISAFDYHPAIKIIKQAVTVAEGGGMQFHPYTWLWDFDNMTYIPQVTLKKLFDLAQWSLFDIPTKSATGKEY